MLRLSHHVDSGSESLSERKKSPTAENGGDNLHGLANLATADV
jgi:hypothetical protein